MASVSEPPPPVRQPVQLNSDQLLELWGRVGAHVGESAASLFEKSRKALIGDGSFHGFVVAVLQQVPNAALPSTQAQHEYGHLVYVQSGGTVQKRLAEIMPGDIVILDDARFKGHKGLHQSYQQAVGTEGTPAVGIVGDFEQKKSKMKVYEANQHVGSQTVELVSYRLEDLKSGTVTVR
ncbi:hypothetical protein SCHPADRAFT_835181 [Schizopora paradoxa]|uniref:BBC1/AIM3 cysteine proteinase-fold domain-containing protein n=1 Tax=Schizopora paradoxa TaxID=27342 RepID=A0A0H2RG80_9AGAM|nr:hypothetical protein SCHPADRAFT_835181 [Schizopora paradoxa]